MANVRRSMYHVWSILAKHLSPATAGQLIVGQGANTDPAWATVSGDATLASSGALTIGAGKITPTKVSPSSATPIVAGAIPAGAGAVPYEIVLAVGNVATGDVTWTAFPFKFFVTGVTVIKTNGAGTATYTVKNGATAITDAIATVNDTDCKYASTIDDAASTIASGGTVVVSVNKTSGDTRAMVVLTGFIAA